MKSDYSLPFINKSEEQIVFQKQFMSREKIEDKESLQNWLEFNQISESQLSLNIYSENLTNKNS